MYLKEDVDITWRSGRQYKESRLARVTRVTNAHGLVLGVLQGFRQPLVLNEVNGSPIWKRCQWVFEYSFGHVTFPRKTIVIPWTNEFPKGFFYLVYCAQKFTTGFPFYNLGKFKRNLLNDFNLRHTDQYQEGKIQRDHTQESRPRQVQSKKLIILLLRITYPFY